MSSEFPSPPALSSAPSLSPFEEAFEGFYKAAASLFVEEGAGEGGNAGFESQKHLLWPPSVGKVCVGCFPLDATSGDDYCAACLAGAMTPRPCAAGNEEN